MLSEADRATVRRWLDEDPVGNAFVIGRAFFEDEPARILVDEASSPSAVVVWQEKSHRLALTASKPESAGELLEGLPEGEYRVSALDVDLEPKLSEVAHVEMEKPSWLFRMDSADFRPHRLGGIRPVEEKYAPLIASLWAPDRNAVEYVRSRIRKGPTAGVYEEDTLVAWDMTHMVTDMVVVLGFLHVLEAHRGRGYGKATATSICDDAFRSGKTPACHVYEDNEASIRLTEGMGFRKVKRQAWATLRKT